jgi:hypothetical protein
MHRPEDMIAVRREILDLLRQQMEALDSPLGLSDSQLIECYARQTRVQELREKLQAASSPESEISSTSIATQAITPSADVAVEQHLSS